MHVDTEAGRSSPFGAPLTGRIAAIAALHAPQPLPAEAGSVIRALPREPES